MNLKTIMSNLPNWSPSGCYIALRVGFAFPSKEINTFSEDWKKHYTVNGLMTQDPLIAWAYQNSGVKCMSTLAEFDDSGFFAKAAGFGLKYGIVVSIPSDSPDGQRSFGIFCRSDRPYEPSEIAELFDAMKFLHVSTALPKLTKAELEALAWIRHGYRMKEVAYFVGITESAVKARLISAKQKLGARNSTHAASIATEYGMLSHLHTH